MPEMLYAPSPLLTRMCKEVSVEKFTTTRSKLKLTRMITRVSRTLNLRWNTLSLESLASRILSELKFPKLSKTSPMLE
jgi:hypothetical protein